MFTSPPGWRCVLFVWLSLCLSARVTHKPHGQNFTKFFYMCWLWLWLDLLWRRRDTLEVLPVLWMASFFSYREADRSESITTLYSKKFARWWYQLNVRQIRCMVEFIRTRHRGWSLLPTIALSIKLLKKQEAFEKCWAHSPQRAASRPFTRCR